MSENNLKLQKEAKEIFGCNHSVLDYVIESNTSIKYVRKR